MKFESVLVLDGCYQFQLMLDCFVLNPFLVFLAF